MNYYNPNFYQNYQPQPYGNPMMSQYNQIMQQNGTPQTNGLNGKIVDSIEVAKATEVPIGSYGIFPKADLGEIYIKSWNNNGTTSITTFQPIKSTNTEQTSQSQQTDKTDMLLQKITELEKKIANLFLSNDKNKSEVKKLDF